MSEKLHIPSHRYGNKEYRDNWDKTFGGKRSRIYIGDKEYNTIADAVGDAKEFDAIIVVDGKKKRLWTPDEKKYRKEYYKGTNSHGDEVWAF